MSAFYLRDAAYQMQQNRLRQLVLIIIVGLTFLGYFYRLPPLLSMSAALFLAGRLVFWVRQPALTNRVGLSKRTQSLLKAVSFIAGTGLVYASHKSLTGVEAGISFMWVCLILKLIEINQPRDRYISYFFALFIAISLFLLGQSFLVFLEVTGSIVAIFTGLYFENNNIPLTRKLYRGLVQNLLDAARLLGRLFLVALPLIIVLFLFFPRLPPLWRLPDQQEQAKTGITDKISPGDIASLGQSNELAFKVKFLGGEQPARKDLYWRGLTLNHFDGTSWIQDTSRLEHSRPIAWTGARYRPEWMSGLYPANRKLLHYQVWMQPSENNWLYTLNFPWSRNTSVGVRSDYTAFTTTPLIRETPLPLYRVNMRHSEPFLHTDDLSMWTEPVAQNPATRLFAQRLYQRVKKDPEEYIKAVLLWFRQQNFGYTLNPPPLGKQRVDSFLFSTRQGYCEHYASAFVALMRDAGIPSRVVVGYQGGQKNWDSGLWEVRQSDAHAWAEIWIKNKGWIRIDPTMAIAPERISLGMETYSATESRVFGEGIRGTVLYQKFRLLQQLRQFESRIEKGWQTHIVSYTQEKQATTLQGWFSGDAGNLQLLAIGGMLVALMTGLLGWLQFSLPRKNPISRLLHQLETRLVKIRPELKRRTDEGMTDWLQRVQMALPAFTRQADSLGQIYQQLYYAPVSDIQKTGLRHNIRTILKNWIRLLKQ